MVGTVKKSMGTIDFRWFSRNVRHVWEGGFRGLRFTAGVLAAQTKWYFTIGPAITKLYDEWQTIKF
jgi:hypothetical protein